MPPKRSASRRSQNTSGGPAGGQRQSLLSRTFSLREQNPPKEQTTEVKEPELENAFDHLSVEEEKDYKMEVEKQMVTSVSAEWIDKFNKIAGGQRDSETETFIEFYVGSGIGWKKINMERKKSDPQIAATFEQFGSNLEAKLDALCEEMGFHCLVNTFANATLQFDLVSQSKLSPQQLEELQKSTHFDKKELQQWYKGKIHFDLFQLTMHFLIKEFSRRLSEGLSFRHSHQRRVSEDLSTVLPVRRSVFIRQLRLQGL